MHDLIEQERFEIEVLDRLNSGRFLQALIFGGGTMLRLCHGLDRYSVDLDFWLADSNRTLPIFNQLKDYFARFYRLRDAAVKHYTLLFELSAAQYPRSLKIEIRKPHPTVETEQVIAYSTHDTRQVLLRAMTLSQMMELKSAALMDRGEIRDAYDMEFLVKRGIQPAGKASTLTPILSRIDSFTKTDYSVKLGSLIGPELRPYYRAQNFRILKTAVLDRLNQLKVG